MIDETIEVYQHEVVMASDLMELVESWRNEALGNSSERTELLNQKADELEATIPDQHINGQTAIWCRSGHDPELLDDGNECPECGKEYDVTVEVEPE